jgi:hypothetical protein
LATFFRSFGRIASAPGSTCSRGGDGKLMAIAVDVHAQSFVEPPLMFRAKSRFLTLQFNNG